MIITCGQCQAKFKVAPEQIKETGSKVRCSNCRYVFTVYRPRPVEAPAPEELEKAYRARSENPLDSFLDDIDRESPASAPSYDHDEHYFDEHDDDTDFSHTDYDDDYSDEPDGLDDYLGEEELSLKERRDRRRRLYADLDGNDGYEDDQADEDPIYDDDDLDETGRPRLRRNRPRSASDDDATPRGLAGSSLDSDNVNQPESATPSDVERGLAADPVASALAEEAAKPKVVIGMDARSAGGTVRSAVTPPPKKRGKYIAAFAVVVILAVAAFLLLNRPDPTSLSTGDENTSQQSPDGDNWSADDRSGNAKITFPNDKQNHYLRENNSAGRILIITGLVRNSYSEPRSFIRLRGVLLNRDGNIVAQREVYAGNIIAEADLAKLPISEISSRLNVKGGNDRQNTNIPPQANIPFMIVFDKLPPDTNEFRIEPLSSTSGE